MKLSLYFATTCFFFLAVVRLTLGQQVVALDQSGGGGENIWPYCQYFEDINGKLGIDEIQKPDVQARFTPGFDTPSSFGFTSSAIWMKFEVRAQSFPQYLSLERVSLWDLRVYMPNASGQYTERQIGACVPLSARDLSSPFSVARLSFPKQQAASVFYLRMETATSLFAPVYVDSTETLLQRLSRLELFYGAYAGILLLVLLFNLITYYVKRNPVYLWYVLYVGSLFLYLGLCNSGLGFQYLWPEHPWVNRYFVVPACLLALSTMVFSMSFLNTGKHLPHIHKGLWGLMAVLLLSIGLSLAGWYHFTSRNLFWLLVPSFVYQLAAGVVSLRRGNRNARFYLGGWGVFLVFYLLFSLWLNGFLGDFFLGHKALYWGSVFEMLLWLTAISDKMSLSEKIERKRELALRKRIARDFHDDIGNQAARLINYVSLLRIRNSVKDDEYRRLNEYSQGLMDGARDFVWALDPKNDELGNLMLHLKDFGEKLLGEKSISFRFHSSLAGPLMLPAGFSRQMLLIFKEAMTNTFKHSDASLAELRVQSTGRRLLVSFRDNGRGIAGEVLSTSDRGIDNMRNRAAALGAALAFRSSPQGTCVELTFECDKLNVTKRDGHAN